MQMDVWKKNVGGNVPPSVKRIPTRSFEANSNRFCRRWPPPMGRKIKTGGLYVTAEFDACQIDFSLVRRVGNESLFLSLSVCLSIQGKTLAQARFSMYTHVHRGN